MNKFKTFIEISIGGVSTEQLHSQLIEKGIQFNKYAQALFEQALKEENKNCFLSWEIEERVPKKDWFHFLKKRDFLKWMCKNSNSFFMKSPST